MHNRPLLLSVQTMKLQACALFFLTLTSGCFSTQSYHHQSTRHELLEREGSSEDERVAYTLASHSSGVPRITRTIKVTHDVAKLGLRGEDVHGDLEDIRFLQPWHGILVQSISRGGAAELAGIAKGDILLKLNDTELSNYAQLRALLTQSNSAGDEVMITLARRNGPTSYQEDPVQIKLTMGSTRTTKTTSNTWDLDSDERVYQLTGLQVGTVPDDLAQELYGSSAPVVLVADSMLGSPAYLAGFRIGDRVTMCDGQPIESHMEISRAVLSRANQVLDLEMPFHVSERTETAANRGPVSLEVSGPQGPHQALLPVSDELADRNIFVIPILFNHRSRVDNTKWSFLDFIFQFGANYSTRYLRTTSRAPASASLFSLFPLGMFEVETDADSYEITLFWSIKISNRH
jgi:membrane-associated protease RseP (regulator of RpoE activity)